MEAVFTIQQTNFSSAALTVLNLFSGELFTGQVWVMNNSGRSEFITSDLSLADIYDPPIRAASITDLMEEGYVLLRPIQIELERLQDGEVLAKFRDANIAMSGHNEQDAFQAMFAEILDTFDDLLDNASDLGPDAARQLDMLSTYIVKA